MSDGLPALPSLPAEPTCAELRAEIEAHLLALPEVDQMLAEVHRTLARHPERHTSAQPLLATLLEHRTEVALRLGLAMASWVRAGGRLDLRAPDARDTTSRTGATTRGLAAPLAEPSLFLPEPPREDDLAPSASPLAAIVPPTLGASPVAPLSEPVVSAARDTPVPAPLPLPAPTPQARVLVELMTLVGPPRYLNTVFEVLEEVEGLEALTRPAAMSRWPLLPKPAQRALLAMAVARTRAVKDKGSLLSPAVRDRLKTVIATFPAYAKRHAPGYVNGLQLSHDPEGLSWRADGLAFWEQLQNFVRRTP